MKKLFLNAYTLLLYTLVLIASSNIFTMNIEPFVIPDDESIYIHALDDVVPIQYKFLKQSKTALNIIEHSITNEQYLRDNQKKEVDPITIPNLTKKNWNELIKLLKMHTKGYEVHALESETINSLAHIINNANYLDIPSIFEPAIEVMINKVKDSKEYICNEKTINKVNDSEKICKNASKINIPLAIEQEIVKQIIPLHINEFITILEAQIFLKKNRNGKLTEDEEIIYENMMKK